MVYFDILNLYDSAKQNRCNTAYRDNYRVLEDNSCVREQLERAFLFSLHGGFFSPADGGSCHTTGLE